METVGNRWTAGEEERIRSSAGNINAMIRFVITSIRDMAGMKILIGPCSTLFFQRATNCIHTYLVLERFIGRSNGSNDG